LAIQWPPPCRPLAVAGHLDADDGGAGSAVAATWGGRRRGRPVRRRLEIGDQRAIRPRGWRRRCRPHRRTVAGRTSRWWTDRWRLLSSPRLRGPPPAPAALRPLTASPTPPVSRIDRRRAPGRRG